MTRFLSRMLIPLALLIIAAGLWQVGGPEQARMEQRDDMRSGDLRALANFLDCLQQAGPEIEQQCGTRPSGIDRFTGEPFSQVNGRVCASFEQPDRVAALGDPRFLDGCILLE